ncbi:MAG TPA: four helix bundle protein [Thermoanaerobaculia bacterium]|jgi:four helix bundle protein
MFKKGADVQARAFSFACEIVELHDALATRGASARVMSGQLLRSGTSVGANLEEADAAQSRADFLSKCGIALKEARESHYWLRLMRATRKIDEGEQTEHLLTEANRLIAILTTIVRKTRATA